MSLFPSEAMVDVLDDRRGNADLIKPDAKGHYYPDGVPFPLAGVSQSAVILLERDEGGYDILMSQRADHMANGGRWALFGGYLEIKLGEGLLTGIRREGGEESKKKIDLSGEVPFAWLPPAVDYGRGATLSLHYLFILRGQKARETRQAVLQAIANKDFDKETKNMDIVALDDGFDDNLAAKGGLVFWQEQRAVNIVRKSLPGWEAMLAPVRAARVGAELGNGPQYIPGGNAT